MVNTSAAHYRISLGGAYIRIWEEKKGLKAEVPFCVVRDKESGEVKFTGEAAQDLEGKLPKNLECIHPFLGDEIIDRSLFMDFLRAEVYPLLWGTRSDWQVWWKSSSCEVVLPPTVTPLHREWLKRSFRQTGWIWWNEQESYARILKDQTSRTQQSQVRSIVDIGFSATRIALYSGLECIAAKRFQQLGIQSLCQNIVDQEEHFQASTFSPEALYDQQWFRQQSAFDHKKQQPVLTVLHKSVVEQSHEAFIHAISQAFRETLDGIPPSLQSHLSQHGILVIGGGAQLPKLKEHLSLHTGLPIEIHKQARYAEVRD